MAAGAACLLWGWVEEGMTALSHEQLLGRLLVVAAKFAEGMTNREIGATLFIAPTTVRTHLSAIYRKLDVRSKVALATLLADHGAQDAGEVRANGFPTDESGPPVVAVIPFDNLSGDEYWTHLPTVCRRTSSSPWPLSRPCGDRPPDHALLQGPTRRRAIHWTRVERRLRASGNVAGGWARGSNRCPAC